MRKKVSIDTETNGLRASSNLEFVLNSILTKGGLSKGELSIIHVPKGIGKTSFYEQLIKSKSNGPEKRSLNS
jgi:hypothetical protein